MLSTQELRDVHRAADIELAEMGPVNLTLFG